MSKIIEDEKLKFRIVKSKKINVQITETELVASVIKGFATITKKEYLENALYKQIYFNEYNNEN